MKSLRHLDRDIRRARLLAARRAPVGGIVRKGILSGQWDLGNVVRGFRQGAAAPAGDAQA